MKGKHLENAGFYTNRIIAVKKTFGKWGLCQPADVKCLESMRKAVLNTNTEINKYRHPTPISVDLVPANSVVHVYKGACPLMLFRAQS